MKIEERLAAIEAKLGIEPPEPAYGLFWDDGDDEASAGICTEERDGEFEINNSYTWNHFVPFNKEEIARFKAAGVPFGEE